MMTLDLGDDVGEVLSKYDQYNEDSKPEAESVPVKGPLSTEGQHSNWRGARESRGFVPCFLPIELVTLAQLTRSSSLWPHEPR